ncbi:MAG: primosomal protein N' [Dehalococcoidales bacterium]|jgi:primosomal protein N' (replication factor Y)|nr:primosomal protein N' [Dehalococcoidales bacterium]MDP6737927.1 primosomal protein N' [Dehalococcoidales bacterium]|tara:strand:- start:2293 stop:4737 length:2445 start_codon:yes stop_codon:yes gene_type:complete
MNYAEVCVNSPAAQRRTFSYAIPPSLTIKVGQAVLVPFGAKLLQGIVLKLSDQPAVEETKEIVGIIETRPVLSSTQVELAYWLSEYYLASIFDGVALMLPPGFERKAQTFVSPTIPDGFDLSRLSAAQKRVLELLPKQSRQVRMRDLEKSLGKEDAQRLVAQLVRQGILVRSYELEPIKVKPKMDLYLSLTITADKAQLEAVRLRRRASKQAALLDLLVQQSRQAFLTKVRQKGNCAKIVADALVKKGLVTMQPVVSWRDPLAYLKTTSSPSSPLTVAQLSALKDVQSSLSETTKRNVPPVVFLLHGGIGSGKTEIYLQSLAETVKLGKKGIVLVPEIALTPQTIKRFVTRFPGRVAVLHSQLSLGERFDEWQRIRDGKFDVVIGPPSALFAPQPKLGLIVIDEEHEWSYKQSDQFSHYYHARNVAIKLAELSGAVVILGSNTPDVETFYHTQRGDYRLLPLAERMASVESFLLPRVEVVDLREELKAGNRSLLSRALFQAITKALADDEQVILFLNRRGGATFIQCRQCGFVLRCHRCDVPLTYHSVRNVLVCHQCNYRIPSPQVCPYCQSHRIKFLGMGIEKLEQETAQAFRQARLLRWDSDTARQKYSHQVVLGKFRNHQADILIGTQMVSKGLGLPQVALVGIINADMGLNLPDFRAGERTFQLLTQVAGRAERGSLSGQVIIQTYAPAHYAVRAAAEHNYPLFYEKEIDYRWQLRQPPFSSLASLIYSHTNDNLCRREAERMKRTLVAERGAQGITDLNIIGPAPAFIHRRRGYFRWRFILRGSNLSAFLSKIPFPRGWGIDIDPIGPI